MPDDLLRLQEVRDFLAGQSWFDVTQYRLNPPWGAPMHWSRLLDVPLAAVMLLARPLLGTTGAELAAATIVPPAMLPSGRGKPCSPTSGGRGTLAPQAKSYGRLATGSLR